MKQLLRLALAAGRGRPDDADARKLDAHQRRRPYLSRLAALPRAHTPSAGRRHPVGVDASPARLYRRAADFGADRGRHGGASALALRRADASRIIAALFLAASAARSGDRSPRELAALGRASLGHRDGVHRRPLALWPSLPPRRDTAPPSRRVPAVHASSSLAFVLGTTAAAAFVTMCIGAYVSSSGAGLACLSIPGCAGNVVVYTPGQYVQMLHRVRGGRDAALCRRRAGPRLGEPNAVRVRAALLRRRGAGCVQVLLGLLNVALRLPIDLREAHAVNAALVFLVVLHRDDLRGARFRPAHGTNAGKESPAR